MDLVNILQGLGSNDSSKRDASLLQLSQFLKVQDSKLESPHERLEKYIKIWNCLFYCKFTSYYQ